MSTFKEFALTPAIQKSIESLGFTTPTEIQEKTIPFLLEHRQDIHAQAQTGTGKTLAFGIPLLHRVDPSLKEVQGLVIAPTRELVLQIYESLKDVARGSNISIEPVFGGMPIERQIAGIKRGAQIIVGTPGRLNDHLRRRTLSLKSLKVLTLDEADIMLDMGFKQEIDAILDHAPANREIWLFSATVMSGIKDLILSHMKNVNIVKSEAKGIVSSQVKQYFCVVNRRKRIDVISRFIEGAPDFYGIIFCQTKLLTSEVTEQLASKGFKVNCLHGDMSQSLRNQIIKGFRNKDFNILVATDVAARGIDISELTHVINFSLPDEFESYIHRIGRTGRAGKEGIAILLIASSEMHKLKRLERSAKISLQEIPIPSIDSIIAIKMNAVSDFIEQSKQPAKQISAVNKVLTEMIASFSEQEIRHAFALSLEDKFFKDIMHEDLGNVEHDQGSYPQEICWELGRDMGISEDAVRNYLYTSCLLSPQDVRKVRVLNNKTFISIPENRLEECLKIIHAVPFGKKKAKAYLVQDVYKPDGQRSDRRSEGRRSDFGGSDRPRGGRRNMGPRSGRRKKPYSR